MDEQELMPAAGRSDACRRAAKDPAFFGQHYLAHYFTRRAPAFHGQLDTLWKQRVMKRMDPLEQAEEMRSAKGSRCAIAAPRGHAKSTVMSLKNVLHAALYGYKQYILLISDTETQAVGFLDAIKNELETNERIIKDFGDQVGKTWKSSSVLLANGCRIDAVGSGQKLRGRRNYQRRPDLILCDDIENDEGVRTVEQRQKTADWFWKAVCKSGDNYTDILFIGTILHHDSLLANLLENPGFRGLTFRAVIAEATSPLWQEWERLITDLSDSDREKTALAFFRKRRREMLKGAKVLWPEKFSYYDLRLMRLTEGEAAFNSEMQNQPIDPSACLFSSQWFRYYQPCEVDFSAPRFRFYGYCDPSLGRSASSDYSAIITLAVDGESGLSYVWDADIQRRHPDRIIQDILDKERLLRRETGRGYTLFGAETNQFQWFLKEQLARESARQGLYLPVQGVRSTEDKTMRVESLQPDVKNGYIRFRADQKLLLHQLSQFPLGAHDDGPDALEGVRTLARKQGRGANVTGLRV
ncbi:MAG: hypothetical protein E7429_02795 [Ruminococcaceae bacterium]|nr:hypothetical protein [Oscillospiraceae bacterium]